MKSTMKTKRVDGEEKVLFEELKRKKASQNKNMTEQTPSGEPKTRS
jgi:hypothetical protein